MSNKIRVVPWICNATTYGGWEEAKNLKHWDQHKGNKELRIIVNGVHIGSTPRYNKSKIDSIIKDNSN